MRIDTDGLRRCPICHRVPVLELQPTRYGGEMWVGGCQGTETICQAYRDIVMQPSLEFAVNQWNGIVADHLDVMAAIFNKVA